MNARMCVFPAARSLKNCEWCNKGTNRRQREAEAIRGCRKDIWLDWIPTAATLQRAANCPFLQYNTIQPRLGHSLFSLFCWLEKLSKTQYILTPRTPAQHNCCGVFLSFTSAFFILRLPSLASSKRSISGRPSQRQETQPIVSALSLSALPLFAPFGVTHK